MKLDIVTEVVGSYAKDPTSITLGKSTGISHIKGFVRFPKAEYYYLVRDSTVYSTVRVGYNEITNTLGVFLGNTTKCGLIMTYDPEYKSWKDSKYAGVGTMSQRIRFASILRKLLLEKAVTESRHNPELLGKEVLC